MIALHLTRCLDRAFGGLRFAAASAVMASAALCTLPGPADAQAPAPGSPPVRATATLAESGPTWANLSPAQQSVLAPLRAEWPTLDSNRKTKWLYVAQRFPSLNPTDQQRVQARMAEWARLTPTQRGQARQNFQELRDLPGADRQALWDAYQSLPAEQRRELAQRASPATAVNGGHVAAAAGATGSAPASGVKRNVVATPAPVTVKSVSPTVVQAKPGATTTLVSKPATPPTHNQPGLPKIAATHNFVNPTTLLPTRGPQGAATHTAAASTAAAASAPASAVDSSLQ